MLRWAPAIVVASLFVTARAFADDVETLEKQLREEHAMLSTQDCVTACRALASIRRAADRICTLEQGARCADARAKADDAQRRVQAACPDCQIAASPPKEDERRATTQGRDAAPAPPQATAESAPRKGGCASCNTPGHRPTGDFGVVILGAWAISRIVRKKSSRRV